MPGFQCCLLIFETKSHPIALTGLKFIAILLPWSWKFWGIMPILCSLVVAVVVVVVVVFNIGFCYKCSPGLETTS